MIARRSARGCHAAKTLFVLFVTSCLSATGFAQQKLEREIRFVRALAREMRFIELAQGEVARLQQTFKNASDQDKLAQLDIEVAYAGAKLKTDRAAQRANYKSAIEKSRELLEQSRDESVVSGARATLADASQEFGQFLIEELEIARTEAPERVKDLEAEADQVFRAGIEACNKVMADLRGQIGKSEAKKIEYGVLWLRKGVLMREQARAVKADRALQIGRAITELEELVLEVGEETALGLRGLFEIAQCREVAGDFKSAIDSYTGTITQIRTALTDSRAGKYDLGSETEEFLFNMMQEVYAHAGDVMFDQGDTAGAEALFKQFHADIKQFGDKGEVIDVVDPKWGHMTLLAECRHMAESGDPSKVGQALTLVQRINDRHPNDYVGVKAKSVLRGILAAQQKLVSGALLFEVAKGEYQNKNYEAAVQGLRRTIAAMSPAEAQKFALEAYDMLGKAYGQTDRNLEALLAFLEGLKRHASANKAAAEPVADNLDRAVARVRAQTKNDPFFEPLFAEAGALIAEYSPGGGEKLFFKAGTDLYGQQKWKEAAAEFAKVTPAFVQYELARVRQAKSLQNAGDFAGARRVLNDYREWRGTKDAVLDPKRTDLAQVREVAIAEADFAEATMAYFEAYGSEQMKLAKDPTKAPKAIELLRGYVSNHGKDGVANVPAALDFIARLHTDRGEMDRAEEAYVQLKEKDGTRASRLATEIFRTYQTQVDNLRKELDAAIAAGKDKPVVDAATNALRNARQKLTALGVDYIQNSPTPQLGVMVATMNGFEALGDWKKVDDVAQRILKDYGAETKKDVKDVVDQTVRPKVGEALLQMRKFQEAYDMLVAAEAANPQLWELKRLLAKALGGWCEFDNRGTLVKVPGLNRPKEAYDKYWGEYQQWGLRKPDVAKYSLDWYRFHWEAYWFALQASAKGDSKMKETATSLFRIAKATDDFATLKGLGVEGSTLHKYFVNNPPK